jgi:hypothetical protein
MLEKLILYIGILSGLITIYLSIRPKERYKYIVLICFFIISGLLVYFQIRDSTSYDWIMKNKLLKTAKCYGEIIEICSEKCVLNSDDKYRGDIEFTVDDNKLILKNKDIITDKGEFFELILEQEYGYCFEKVMYYQSLNNLLIVSEITDIESVGIELYYFKNGRELAWKKEIGGFNISNGVVENEQLYITWIGTVLKMEIQTGKTIWVNDNLYQYSEGFEANAMEIITIGKEEIVIRDLFTEKKVSFNKFNGNLNYID